MIINVMLVGLGNIAMGYDLENEAITWTHVKALLNDDRFLIHSAVDPNPESRMQFKGITNALVFENLESALNEASDIVDLYVIATPTELHYEQYCKIVMHSQHKNILIEKPICKEVDDLNRMERDYLSGQSIMVNLFRLYQSQIDTHLKFLSKNGKCRISVTYSKGLVHNGIHFFTLLLRYFGECISQRAVKDSGDVCYEFKFQNAIATFNSSMNNIDDNSLIVNSGVGSLFYLSGGRHSFFIDKNFNKTDFDMDEFMHYQKYVYDHVYKNFVNKESYKDSSFELAVKAQRILSEIEVAI